MLEAHHFDRGARPRIAPGHTLTPVMVFPTHFPGLKPGVRVDLVAPAGQGARDAKDTIVSDLKLEGINGLYRLPPGYEEPVVEVQVQVPEGRVGELTPGRRFQIRVRSWSEVAAR